MFAWEATTGNSKRALEKYIIERKRGNYWGRLAVYLSVQGEHASARESRLSRAVDSQRVATRDFHARSCSSIGGKRECAKCNPYFLLHHAESKNAYIILLQTTSLVTSHNNDLKLLFATLQVNSFVKFEI